MGRPLYSSIICRNVFSLRKTLVTAALLLGVEFCKTAAEAGVGAEAEGGIGVVAAGGSRLKSGDQSKVLVLRYG